MYKVHRVSEKNCCIASKDGGSMPDSRGKTQALRVISVIVVTFITPENGGDVPPMYSDRLVRSHTFKDPHGVIGADIPGTDFLSRVISSDRDERQIERPEVLADLLEG